MACEIQMIKVQGCLRPAQQADADAIEKIRAGAPILAKIVQMRNPKFHARFFAMLNFAYEYFQPEVPTTRSGIVPERNFDRFREDVTILAGFYDVVVNIKGEARYQAKSISFGSMDEIEFERVYQSVFSVCWNQVLKHVRGMTEAVAENTILQMQDFG